MTAAPSAQGSASGRIRRALACVRPFLPRTLLVRTFALLGLLLVGSMCIWLVLFGLAVVLGGFLFRGGLVGAAGVGVDQTVDELVDRILR